MHDTVHKSSDCLKLSALHLRFAPQPNDLDGTHSPLLFPQDHEKNKTTTITTMWTRVRSVDCITAAAVASKWSLSPSETSFPASSNVQTSFLLPPTPSSPLTSALGSATDSYFPSLLSQNANAVQQKQ
ncbi:hypothetical protein MBLNU457_4600t1 [Dothideomycetes sp. NU457]